MASITTFILNNFSILAVLVGWAVSTIAVLMFLSRWFGRFETQMAALVKSSEESGKDLKDLRNDMHEIGERVANVEGRVTSLENRR